MHLFGLTGGIASGKSAVAARFRARGLAVLDADQIARDVVLPGTPGLAEIVAAFGSSVLSPEGELDRKRLGAIIFADEDARRRLNAITHPRIGAASMQRAADLGARGEPLVCYEAALLVENGLADAMRPLVLVAAPIDVQIARTAARDGCTEGDARARIAAQMPLDAKRGVADFVIENDGSLEDLRTRADAVLRAVCARTGVDPARYTGPAP